MGASLAAYNSREFRGCSMVWRNLLAVGVVVLLAGCASSASDRAKAQDQMTVGVEAGQRGYWQEALFRFERARTLAPGNPEVLNNLAVALEAVGRYDDALTTYKKALEVAPKNQTLRKNYARFAEFFTSFARGVKPKGEPNATR